MIIGHDLLEKTCKNMIETILLCLDHATKGTIYRIGPMPELRSVRVTSGIREQGNCTIYWGLPAVSDYNPPGKTWEQYRDRPGRALEAMAWCVERQKSWTADNPYEDQRSVRKQLSGEPEDWHHMEPVLVKKSDLYGEDLSGLEYPLNWKGTPIWQDTDYVVVAVIKIHFLPHSIQRGDRATKVIKKLSRILGTEMFSLHIRETLSQVQSELTQERFASCNALAHELRNTLMKLSFIFSAINAEVGFLREQWEEEIRKHTGLEDKTTLLGRLNEFIETRLENLNGHAELGAVGRNLLAEQKELLVTPLLPEQAANWIAMKIQPKWERLLEESSAWNDLRQEIQGILERLKSAVWVGTDQEVADRLEHLPQEVRTLWPQLAYMEFSAEKLPMLDQVLALLNHPGMEVPHKKHTQKVLSSLKALAKIIPDMETRTNRILQFMRNGTEKGLPDYWRPLLRPLETSMSSD
ncbi:hypothetical protein [Desulfosoma sp.]|uniref:hypothetical protein n=1 Tax=Desulfosoma sp. TaxID=2603217 RepID=UPI0040496EC9